MATVIVTPTAIADLNRLMTTQTLPTDTIERFKRSISVLERFPEIGTPLRGRWAPSRFVVGPWRWILIVYVYDVAADQAAIVTVQDARSGEAARSDAQAIDQLVVPLVVGPLTAAWMKSTCRIPAIHR